MCQLEHRRPNGLRWHFFILWLLCRRLLPRLWLILHPLLVLLFIYSNILFHCEQTFPCFLTSSSPTRRAEGHFLVIPGLFPFFFCFLDYPFLRDSRSPSSWTCQCEPEYTGMSHSVQATAIFIIFVLRFLHGSWPIYGCKRPIHKSIEQITCSIWHGYGHLPRIRSLQPAVRNMLADHTTYRPVYISQKGPANVWGNLFRFSLSFFGRFSFVFLM